MFVYTVLKYKKNLLKIAQSEVLNEEFTCNNEGPITGIRNPEYKNSCNCCLIIGCATCATALQNSNEFINDAKPFMSFTSSGVNLCQSSASISSKVCGKFEYKPLNPKRSVLGND